MRQSAICKIVQKSGQEKNTTEDEHGQEDRSEAVKSHKFTRELIQRYIVLFRINHEECCEHDGKGPGEGLMELG